MVRSPVVVEVVFTAAVRDPPAVLPIPAPDMVDGSFVALAAAVPSASAARVATSSSAELAPFPVVCGDG
jgi:hypothetical protein